MKRFLLTDNGNYHINRGFRDAKSAVYVSGTLGTATATLTYKNQAGLYIPFTDGLLVINDQLPVDHGVGVNIYVTVANADGTTAIDIMCAGVD